MSSRAPPSPARARSSSRSGAEREGLPLVDEDALHGPHEALILPTWSRRAAGASRASTDTEPSSRESWAGGGLSGTPSGDLPGALRRGGGGGPGGSLGGGLGGGPRRRPGGLPGPEPPPVWCCGAPGRLEQEQRGSTSRMGSRRRRPPSAATAPSIEASPAICGALAVSPAWAPRHMAMRR